MEFAIDIGLLNLEIGRSVDRSRRHVDGRTKKRQLIGGITEEEGNEVSSLTSLKGNSQMKSMPCGGCKRVLLNSLSGELILYGFGRVVVGMDVDGLLCCGMKERRRARKQAGQARDLFVCIALDNHTCLISALVSMPLSLLGLGLE